MIKKVLAINYSDTSGKNGIQADLKTFQESNVFGFTALTSLQTINDNNLIIQPVSSDILRQQLNSVFSDGSMDAIKIGQISSMEEAEVIISTITRFHSETIILELNFTDLTKDFYRTLIHLSNLIIIKVEELTTDLEVVKKRVAHLYTQENKHYIIEFFAKHTHYLSYNGVAFSPFTFNGSNLSGFITAKSAQDHSLSFLDK